MILPDPAEFYNQIRIDPETGCHLWLGRTDRNGYGVIKLRPYAGGHRTNYSAHVVGYKLRHPEGVPKSTPFLDHLCRNRRCVYGEPGTFNVYYFEEDVWRDLTHYCHLEPVTPRENTLRGQGPTAVNFRKDVCTLGHPLEGRRKTYGNVTETEGRYCLICHRDRMRRSRAATRSSSLLLPAA